MNSLFLHPATFKLLWLQSRGRRRRLVRRFCEPRRLILSVIAAVLAVAWLGNAALTVWLRERATPDTLAALLSLGLVVYATWHFAKAAFFRPESPFEWTPAERDLLAAMPLLPRDLVGYQVASVTITTILKAGLLTVLLLPDLRCVPLGFVGVVLALLALEMLRMAVDIATWGMSRRAFLAYRTVVVAGLVAAGGAIGLQLLRNDAFARIELGTGVLDRLLVILVELNGSVLAYAQWPFKPFLRLILADSITPANLWLAAASSALVVASALAVIGLYTRMATRVARRERIAYLPNSGKSKHKSFTSTRASLREPLIRIPHLGGAGALAWRQLLGARRHWGSLLTAMIAPAILTCGPLFVVADPTNAFLLTVATLAFYTFLLLPTALRFDFRRDFERLAILKGLPISPAAVVVGQTFAPVLLATLFQAAVLAFAIAARALPWHFLPVTIAVMIPLNLLVFAVDNLIFLLYPHRLQQEGLEVFFRTMLTFTAKGLLFAAGMALVATWGLAAATLTRSASNFLNTNLDAHTTFAAGLILGPALLAFLVLNALARTYRGLDAIEDSPR